jgi:eukaryotic-like serine/threonine-protein kinase
MPQASPPAPPRPRSRRPPRPLRPGRSLAPGYTVVEHLARGEALDVYDAWDDERHCRCVVKLPRPDRAEDPGTCASLRREGRLLTRLAHPHLVRAYALLPGPPPALVLETLGGETLAHLLATSDRRLSGPQLALLGAQLASALRYLHAQDHLHLDLKPSNVVVELGLARLLDLSVARRPGRAPRGMGTPDYMAPEQALGEPLSAATDVWGLGTVLFEAAAGRPAFAGRGDDLAQLDGRARRIRTVRRVPAPLARVIDGALEPRPRDRPALDDALADLESV